MQARRFAFVLILVVIVSASIPVSSVRAQSSDEAAAAEIVEKLNAWRISEGTWPLKVNPTLEALALAQAQYLMTLPDIPDGGDIHLGRSGEGPKIRAQQDPYDWPTYGRPEQIALDEIAYVGHDADAALTFWQGSSVHRRSSLNSAYREVGVAALPHRFGHLYIVVLGSRPNVLPVTFDPAASVLYLTNETFSGARGELWIKDATEVKLFDADGRPVRQGWRPWQPTLPLSGVTSDNLYVAFSDGSVEVLAPVRFTADQAMLPVTEPTGTAAPPAVMVVPGTATPVPTQTPTTPTGSTPSGATVVPVAPTPTTAAASSGGGDVMLVYDSRSLAVVNTSGQTLDLSKLDLFQDGSSFPITNWQTQWLAAPLESFPAGDCLQVWSWDEPEDVPPPPNCDNQRGVIFVAPEQRFWAEADFAMRWRGTSLAECHVGGRTCAATLPES